MNRESSPLQRTEQALLDSEHRLQQVLDNSGTTVFAKDSGGRYLFVNREFERVTGRVAGTILGRTDDELFTPELATRFRQNDLRVLLEKRSIQFEEAGDFGDGMRTFISSKFPLFDSDGVPYAVCGMSADITDRKRMEDAFSAAALAVSQSEEETLYRQLAKYLAAILGVECAFIATVASDKACDLRMLAFSLDGEVHENFDYPILGTPCETVVGHGYRLYHTRLSELFPLVEDFRQLRLESYAGHPLADSSGNPLGLIAVIARRPFENPALVEATLRIFAVRVNAELERAAAAAALRASETNYRQIFEAAEDSIGVHDAETGAVVDVNPRACETYGYTREEFLRLTLRDLSAGEPHYTEAEALRWFEHAKREGSAAFEWHCRNKDGSLQWAEVRLKRAQIGGKLRIVTFSREITERKLAEEALRASEEQYRAIFNASTDALVLGDSQFRRVDVNPAFEKMYGWTREEVVGRGYAEAAPQPDFAGTRHELIRRALAGETARAELEAVRKNGEQMRIEVAVIPFRHRGEPHVLAITRDITERKRAEEALRASEEQYRAVFNASADALVLWNSRSERVDVNPAYERMYGYSREEVLAGARTRELEEGHRQLQAQIISRTLAGESYHGEIETVGRSGGRFPIEVRTIPIRHRGEPHVLAMIRDLTERRRVEQERVRLEAQLRQAQKMEAIGQLAGGIAHDFNNLLTSIMGYVALAGGRDAALGDPRLTGYLAQAHRSCERARDLIQQMLTFSRGHRGSPRAVALASVARGALATLQAAMPATLEVNVQADESVTPVQADPAQVEQVLLNLCINARDAAAGVGHVRIGVWPARTEGLVCSGCRQSISGQFVELVVEDDGHGMTPEVMERIFEPFFSTKDPGKGSGMGLAMVHGIVHEHGGHVVVESAPGRGSRFRVLWPALTDPLDVAPSEPDGIGSRQCSRPALRGSVLVVDDDESVGAFMRELLETWGLQVVCLPRPDVALELLRDEPRRFDVLITDQTMPKMSGMELALQIRRFHTDLPIILYTGHGEGLAGAEAGAAGLSAVMRKPIDPVELEQVLTRCLASGPAR